MDGEAHRLDVSWQANERSRHAQLCLPHGIKTCEQTPSTREQLVRQCHEASVRPCVRRGCTDTVRRLDLSARGRQRHGDERCGHRAADARDTVEKESAVIGPVPQKGDETLDVPHRWKDLPRLWLTDVVDPQTQMAGAPDLGRGWGLFLGRHERDKVSRPETLDVFRHSLQTADVDATHAKIIACSCTALSAIPSRALRKSSLVATGVRRTREKCRGRVQD